MTADVFFAVHNIWLWQVTPFVLLHHYKFSYQ